MPYRRDWVLPTPHTPSLSHAQKIATFLFAQNPLNRKSAKILIYKF